MISANIDIKAQFYDLDPMNVVWHGNYVRFYEQARCELLDKISYNYDQMYESGYVWPIIDMRLKYVRPVRFGQVVTVKASLVEYENRLKIDYLVTDTETGIRLNKGYTIQVAVNRESEEMQLVSPPAFQQLVKDYLCAK